MPIVFNMDLSIITVTHQSQDHIDACILSVITHTLHCRYEHIIVDNASTDATLSLIETGYLNCVRLIKNSINQGFAHANNQALSQATGRYLLFLNPDMQLCEGSLDTLIAWMDQQPEAGIATCKLVTSNKQPHPVLRPHRFPTLSAYLPALLKLKPFFCTVNPRFFYSAFDDDKEQPVDVVRGSFILISRDTLNELGFAFDPRYFILFEDVDLCRTIHTLGKKVLYTPLISCIDHYGQSFSKQPQPWKYLQMARSLKSYAAKWHSPLHLLWLNAAIALGYLLRIREWGLKNSWKAFRQPRF